jgi:aspartate oxidase
MVNQTQTKKRKNARVDNVEHKSLHSITFYIPNKKIVFFTEALKEVSKKVYEESGKRCVSKYIRDLIYKDFQKRNLLDEEFNPNVDGLKELKEDN